MSALSVAVKLGMDVSAYEAGIRKVTSNNTNANTSFKGLTNSINGVAGSLTSAIGVNTNFMGSLSGLVRVVSSIGGSVPSVFKSVSGSISGMAGGVSTGLKSMYGAIASFMTQVTATVAATGIGAIVIAIAAALAGLVAWLKNSQRGVDELRGALNSAKAVIEVVLTKLANLGSAIVNIFKGDFKNAINDIKDAFTGWGDALQENLNRGNELTRLQIEYEKWLVKHNLRLSEMNKSASEYALIMRDESYSIAEREEALKRYRDIQLDIYKEKKRDIEYQIRIMELEQAQGFSSREDLKKLQDLKAQLIDLQAQYNNEIKSTLRLEGTLSNEVQAMYNKALKQIEDNAASSIKIKINTNVELSETNPFEEFESSVETVTEHMRLKLEDVTTMGYILKESFTRSILDIGATYETFLNGTKRVFTQVGTTLLQSAGTVKDYAKNIKLALRNAVTAVIGEAVMTVVAAQLKKYAWLNPAIALGIAAAAGGVVSSSLNQISAQFFKFASGGIVGGNNFYGDMVPAMVNSGEMILNSAQQRNLFRMLNTGVVGNSIGEVRFEIEGDKLVGVLNNYNQINSRL